MDDMKRILSVVTLCLLVGLPVLAQGKVNFAFLHSKKKCTILHQSEGNISFTVDEGLTAPTGHLGMMDMKNLPGSILGKFGISQEDYHVVDASFDNDQISISDDRNFFTMVTMAYADHRPLCISPDDVWLLISQGFAQHVNQNAEALRDRIVSHQGKLALVVNTRQALLGDEDFLRPGQQAEPVDWTEIFDGFVEEMRKNSKDGIADRMCADFSTTTVASRIASQITLMNAVQPYFNYRVNRIGCGIPYVRLLGTPEDWQKILDRTRALEQYDLKWWTDRLCPVLEQFVKTAQGKPNAQFWQCMAIQIAPERLRHGMCGPSEIDTKFDGWFLNFFPYDQAGNPIGKDVLRCYGDDEEPIHLHSIRISCDLGIKISQVAGLSSQFLYLPYTLNGFSDRSIHYTPTFLNPPTMVTSTDWELPNERTVSIYYYSEIDE